MLLRRYVQENLWYSRRKLFALIQEGKVLLNNIKVDNFSCAVADADVLIIDAVQYIVTLGSVDKQLIAFHKPVWYVVSSSDPHNKTIYSILPEEFSHYRYIGRLDKDSRGLLLLSNDLDLVHRLTHPSYAGKKVYDVQLDTAVADKDIKKLLQWVQDSDEMLRMVDLVVLDWDYHYRITLQEGKNRHIRRMFVVLGYEVLDLCRISQGEYMLGDLEEGKYTIVHHG